MIEISHVDKWYGPVFQALKDENPELVTMSRGYREPVCFNTEFNISRKP